MSNVVYGGFVNEETDRHDETQVSDFELSFLSRKHENSPMFRGRFNLGGKEYRLVVFDINTFNRMKKKHSNGERFIAKDVGADVRISNRA